MTTTTATTMSIIGTGARMRGGVRMRLARAAVSISAAAVLALGLGTPAAAAGPDSTAVLSAPTYVQPGRETGEVDFAVECGSGATTAFLDVVWGPDRSASYSLKLDADRRGTISIVPALAPGFPGAAATATLDCWIGGTSVARSAPVAFDVPDAGTALDAPTAVYDDGLRISGTCGTSGADFAWVLIDNIGQFHNVVGERIALAADGSFSKDLGSPMQLGLYPLPSRITMTCGLDGAQFAITAERIVEFSIAPSATGEAGEIPAPGTTAPAPTMSATPSSSPPITGDDARALAAPCSERAECAAFVASASGLRG